MKLDKNIILIITIILLVLAILISGTNYWLYLRKVHSTFDSYYIFRGCVQLLQKTDSYGTCRLASGNVIKIIEYQNKWYLDGDLPWACLGNICFGM